MKLKAKINLPKGERKMKDYHRIHMEQELIREDRNHRYFWTQSNSPMKDEMIEAYTKEIEEIPSWNDEKLETIYEARGF